MPSPFRLVKLADQISLVNIIGGYTPRGEFNAGTTYVVGDGVSYNGSSYVLYFSGGGYVAGTIPKNTTYWQVVSEKGTGGGGGVTSVNGDVGPAVVLTAADVGAVPAEVRYDLSPIDPTELGYDKDHPYVLGTHGENHLHVMFAGSAFILIPMGLPIDSYKIVNGGAAGGIYIGMDAGVSESAVAYDLPSFNGLRGWFISSNTGVFMELKNVFTDVFQVFTPGTNLTDEIDNTQWNDLADGATSDEGFCVRNSLKTSEFSALRGGGDATALHYHMQQEVTNHGAISIPLTGCTMPYYLYDVANNVEGSYIKDYLDVPHPIWERNIT